MKMTEKGSYEKKGFMVEIIKKEISRLVEDITPLLDFLVDFDISYNPSTFILNEQYKKSLVKSMNDWVNQKNKSREKPTINDVEFLKVFKSILVDAKDSYEKNSQKNKKHVAIDVDKDLAEKMSIFFDNWKPNNDTDLYVLKKVHSIRDDRFLLDITFGIVKKEREKALARLSNGITSKKSSVQKRNKHELNVEYYYDVLRKIYLEHTVSKDFLFMPVEWILDIVDYT